MFYQEPEPSHFHAEHQGQHRTFDFDARQMRCSRRQPEAAAAALEGHAAETSALGICGPSNAMDETGMVRCALADF